MAVASSPSLSVRRGCRDAPRRATRSGRTRARASTPWPWPPTPCTTGGRSPGCGSCPTRRCQAPSRRSGAQAALVHAPAQRVPGGVPGGLPPHPGARGSAGKHAAVRCGALRHRRGLDPAERAAGHVRPREGAGAVPPSRPGPPRPPAGRVASSPVSRRIDPGPSGGPRRFRRGPCRPGLVRASSPGSGGSAHGSAMGRGHGPGVAPARLAGVFPSARARAARSSCRSTSAQVRGSPSSPSAAAVVGPLGAHRATPTPRSTAPGAWPPWPPRRPAVGRRAARSRRRPARCGTPRRTGDGRRRR